MQACCLNVLLAQPQCSTTWRTKRRCEPSNRQRKTLLISLSKRFPFLFSKTLCWDYSPYSECEFPSIIVLINLTVFMIPSSLTIQKFRQRLMLKSTPHPATKPKKTLVTHLAVLPWQNTKKKSSYLGYVRRITEVQIMYLTGTEVCTLGSVSVNCPLLMYLCVAIGLLCRTSGAVRMKTRCCSPPALLPRFVSTKE